MPDGENLSFDNNYKRFMRNNDIYHEYVPLVVNTSLSFPHSSLITGFVARLTRRVSLVEQELPTLPEHMSSPPIFSGVRVTRSFLMLCCSLFVLLSFLFWPLCCLSFFDLRILNISLISSNSSNCTHCVNLVLVLFSYLELFYCLSLVKGTSVRRFVRNYFHIQKQTK
jgi:hypothetical protein